MPKILPLNIRQPYRYVVSERSPLFLFSHGVNGGIDHPDCLKWMGLLSKLGRVEGFNYWFARSGFPVRPPAAAALVDQQVREFNTWRERFPKRPIIMVGKSMGSRVACMASLQVDTLGVVCLSFPLVAGATGMSRDGELRATKVPVLFVQGTQDKLCPLNALQRIMTEVRNETELHVMESANHSLRVGRRFDQVVSDQLALNAIAKWVKKLLQPTTGLGRAAHDG